MPRQRQDRCSRCGAAIDRARTTLEVVEHLLGGRRLELRLCEGCSVDLARFLDGAGLDPRPSSPASVEPAEGEGGGEGGGEAD
jgi:hypothetical protein